MIARKLTVAALICLLWTTSALAAGEASYSPGPDDVLHISVWKEEALTREVVVRPDGKISMPLIGDVVVAGRPITEVREEIQTKMDEFSPGAPVSIIVTKVQNPRVYIVGKVTRPGVYPLTERMTVAQALALAGGFSPFASTDDILVLREARGKTQAMPFDYDAVIKGKHLEQNVYLERGDTIVVP